MDADHALCDQACKVAVDIDEYDALPALVKAAEGETHQYRQTIHSTLIVLAEKLQAEFSRPRNYKKKRDPLLVRRHVVSKLEASMSRYEEHGSRDIVEAFLLLVRRDNATLCNIVNNPMHVAFSVVRDTLRTSQMHATY